MSEGASKQNGRRVKQREIAARAGVSVSTVSRVLNNMDSISEEVRQRVLHSAADLAYRRQSVSGHRGLKTIGLFASMMNLSLSLEPFQNDVLRGIEAECQRHHVSFSFTLLEKESGNDNVLDKIAKNNFDGVLLLSVDDDRLVRRLIEHDVNTVVVNAEHPTLAVDVFVPDNEIGPLLAMRHLIAHGHRRILHVTNLKRKTLQRRFRACQAALEEAGISFDPALVLDCPLDTETSHEAMRNLLQAGEPEFTAVFCSSDLAAIGAMHALQEAGHQIPDDISIIGYDDIQIAAYVSPPLTTVRIEREELGVRAVRGLLERAANSHLKPVRVEIATCLIERGSVAVAKISLAL